MGSPWTLTYWKNLYSHLYGPDWFSFFFIIFGILYGMRKGVLREAVEIFEFCIIIALSFFLQEFGTGFFVDMIPGISYARMAPVVFVLAAWLVWFFVAMIDKYLQTTVQSKIPYFIKTSGGALLGAVHFFIIWSFFSHAIYIIPNHKVKAPYDNKKSISANTVRDLAPQIYQTAKELTGFSSS